MHDNNQQKITIDIPCPNQDAGEDCPLCAGSGTIFVELTEQELDEFFTSAVSSSDTFVYEDDISSGCPIKHSAGKAS
jgi:hypothetical protein